ncbi:hypothetical protein D1872_248540 [compost metagenome]
MLFNRSFSRQIIDFNVVFLSKTMDTANSLLDSHRVPWQIKVDHMMAELQVDPFSACFCCNHDLGSAAEQIHHPILFPTVHAASIRNSGQTSVFHVFQQVFLGSPVFGKNNDLVLHALNQLHCLFSFAVRCDGPDNIDQIPNFIPQGRIRRQLLGQIHQSDKDRITAAANLSLKRYEG